MKRPFFTVSVQGPGGELLFRLQVPAGVAVLTAPGFEDLQKPSGEAAGARQGALTSAQAPAADDPCEAVGPGAPPGEPAAAGSASQAPTGKRPRRWYKTPPELVAEARRLLGDGVALAEISRRTGVALATISRLKLQAGLPPGPPRAPSRQLAVEASQPPPPPDRRALISRAAAQAGEFCKCGLRKPCNACLTEDNDRFTRRDPPAPF